MNRTLRAVAAGTSLIALAVAVLTACPALAADAGLDVWNLPALHDRIAECEREEARLAREDAVTLHREAVRGEVSEGVLSGHVTPEEAVGAFVELNRSDARALDWTRLAFPGGTDEERARHQLVSHLRASDHPRAKAVAAETARRLGVPVPPGPATSCRPGSA